MIKILGSSGFKRKMKIILTYKEIQENHDWDLFCKYFQLDPYFISEGFCDEYDIVSLSVGEAVECGILSNRIICEYKKLTLDDITWSKQPKLYGGSSK